MAGQEKLDGWLRPLYHLASSTRAANPTPKGVRLCHPAELVHEIL